MGTVYFKKGNSLNGRTRHVVVKRITFFLPPIIGAIFGVWASGGFGYAAMRLFSRPGPIPGLFAALVVPLAIERLSFRLSDERLIVVPWCAAAYALIGLVLQRAVRRLPGAFQDPGGRRLVRRFVFYFAAIGYLLPLCWYGLSPSLGQAGVDLLPPVVCFLYVFDAHPGVGTFIFVCPVNAAFLSLLGWIVGRAFRRGAQST